MKVQIVKFNNGTYAVRKTKFFGEHYYCTHNKLLDGNCELYWWPFRYIKHAVVDNIEEARQIIQDLKNQKNYKADYGQIVEEHKI